MHVKLLYRRIKNYNRLKRIPLAFAVFRIDIFIHHKMIVEKKICDCDRLIVGTYATKN